MRAGGSLLLEETPSLASAPERALGLLLGIALSSRLARSIVTDGGMLSILPVPFVRRRTGKCSHQGRTSPRATSPSKTKPENSRNLAMLWRQCDKPQPTLPRRRTPIGLGNPRVIRRCSPPRQLPQLRRESGTPALPVEASSQLDREASRQVKRTRQIQSKNHAGLAVA